MRVMSYICIFSMLLISCSVQDKANKERINIQKSKFVAYINTNTTNLVADGIQLPDKKFSLRIPANLRFRKKILGEAFVQIFDNNEHETIVTIFIPDNKNTPIVNFKDMPFDQFADLSEKERILSILEDDIEFRRHRRFGIYKPGAESFYIVYLNVKRSNIASFNYPLASINLD